MESFFSVLVVSAGQGTRFGDKKQFTELGGLPLFFHSYLAFQNCLEVKEIIFVINLEDKETYLEWFKRLEKKFTLSLPYSFTLGGEERYLSVRNGLGQCDPRYPFVMIHDAARPLIRLNDLKKLISFLIPITRSEITPKGVVPYAPVTDTIKVIDQEQQVVDNLKRDSLAAVSTPQGFVLSELIKANQSIEKNEHVPTDDVEVFMAAGHSVKAVKLDHPNPKVTYRYDLHLAEEIYQRDQVVQERKS